MIPHSVALNRAKKADGELKMVTEKELQEENGGAGVYSADLRKNYMLDDDDWKYDIVPEIYNGKNVADFIDPDIDERLAELEREEDELEEKWATEKAELAMEAEEDMDDDEKAMLREVRAPPRRARRRASPKKSAGNNAPDAAPHRQRPHADPAKRATTKRMKESLGAMGIDPSAASRGRGTRARRGRVANARSRSAAPDEDMGDAEGGEDEVRRHSSKSRSVSVAKRTSRSKGGGAQGRGRCHARAEDGGQGAEKMNKRAKIGEADRSIITKMPKHLFSGKRGIGKTDRR